jgi:hypothetical protein
MVVVRDTIHVFHSCISFSRVGKKIKKIKSKKLKKNNQKNQTMKKN